MRTILHKLRRALTAYVEHGSEGATPQMGLLIRRARGFGLVAFAVMVSAMIVSLLEGRATTAYFSIGGMIVYGVCMHLSSRERGRYARLACNASIAYLLATITAACVYLGDAPAASVTYPSLLLLGTMHVLGIRTAAVWTALSLGCLAYVTFTATLPPPAEGGQVVGPAFVFASRAFVLVGVFVIAGLGRRFEDGQTEQLQFLARHDPLTGLFNRREFEERLGQAISRARRYARQPALLFIDLDELKQINDDHGHALGDAVLRGVAEALNLKTRMTDAAGRIGGDEFVVLLEDSGDEKNAERYALRLLDELAATESQHAASIRVRASIGVALYPEDGDCIDSLTRAADTAMYRAKREGGNRVALASGTGSKEP